MLREFLWTVMALCSESLIDDVKSTCSDYTRKMVTALLVFGFFSSGSSLVYTEYFAPQRQAAIAGGLNKEFEQLKAENDMLKGVVIQLINSTEVNDAWNIPLNLHDTARNDDVQA